MNLKNSLNHISHKTIALFIITAFLLPSFSLIIIVAAEEETYQNITVDTANYMITHENIYPNLVILDVRDTTEFNLGHLYDSILIPLNELEARIGELEDYKISEIIIYCKSGYRTQQASEILGEYGFIKIYNMIGGILAWIDADYPIWTTSHHITVDEITDKKFELLIEPQLLYYTGCSSCTDCSSCNENQECPIESESINITSEILEQGENYLKTITYYEFNGTVYESIHTNTLLWSYDKVTNNINKTIYFTSTEIMSENSLFQFYQLDYFIDHQNYKLTIQTTLEPEPQNLDTYSVALSTIKYVPVNGNPITSMEFIKFNMSVTLSQQYDILADIAEEMAEIYINSDDQDIMTLHDGYINIGEEFSSLSELVKEQLAAYDYHILENYAVLRDYLVPNGGGGDPPPPPPPVGCFGGDPYWDCFWCEVAVGFAAIGLMALCAATVWWFPLAAAFCITALDMFLATGSTYIACQIFGCC